MRYIPLRRRNLLETHQSGAFPLDLPYLACAIEALAIGFRLQMKVERTVFAPTMNFKEIKKEEGNREQLTQSS